MKCLFLSLQQRLRLFGALRSKMTVFFFVVVFFFPKWLPPPPGAEQNFSDFFAAPTPTEEATALFSVRFAPYCPPTTTTTIRSQQNVKYLSDSNVFFSPPFIVWFSCRCYFKVVSLALTVCVWLVDATCWLFFFSSKKKQKTRTRPRVCHVEERKEEEKCCFYGTGAKKEREREKKKRSHRRAPSPLRFWWKCVCMCV